MTEAVRAGGGRLTAVQGAALYVGAVLGTGVIALPAMAARVAGPASLLAWLGLSLVSIPLAVTFAALGSRHPDAGGVATYARLAFGPRASAVVGWCFLATMPVGAPAAALWVGGYVATALGGGTANTLGAATNTLDGATMTANVTAIAVLALGPLPSAFGMRLTGRVQLGLAGLLTLFLLTAIVLSLPSAHLGNLRPFVPHGWSAIGPAAALLVWCFVGWEVVTHLTAEFRRPERDVPRATALAVIVVGTMYLAVAFATVVVLGPGAADSDAPLGDLLAAGWGGNARVLAAAVAALLTFGTMNVYYAGGAKLAAALGRDGALPSWLSHGSRAGEIPRRSLAVLSVVTMVALLLVEAAGTGTRPLVLVTSGLFVLVYAVGMAAGVRLLPRRSGARRAAMVAFGFVLLLLLMSGRYLVWPLLVAAGALLYRPRVPVPES